MRRCSGRRIERGGAWGWHEEGRQLAGRGLEGGGRRGVEKDVLDLESRFMRLSEAASAKPRAAGACARCLLGDGYSTENRGQSRLLL